MSTFKASVKPLVWREWHEFLEAFGLGKRYEVRHRFLTPEAVSERKAVCQTDHDARVRALLNIEGEEND